MIEISISAIVGAVAKGTALALALPALALIILFPINDQPTSGTQKLVFVLTVMMLFDMLFTHMIWSYITAHVQFVP